MGWVVVEGRVCVSCVGLEVGGLDGCRLRDAG